MTSSDNTTTDNAQSQAAAQYASIVSMLAAVNCDYARLEELKEERDSLQDAVSDAVAENERPGNWDARQEASMRLKFFTEHGKPFLDVTEVALKALTDWDDENMEELKTLQEEAGDFTDEEEARERIQEDPLEVQVRSDWTTPGEELKASEFMILLCTGGPAVRIVGELNQHGEPDRAWLEYQDWGTPWTRYFAADSDVLVEYASHFYFQV